jgi:uncharacterized protein YlzI (FlbEa/FlbD family)
MLIDDLPRVIEFVDTFLEILDPLPVAKHESGEIRVFSNTFQRIMDDHPNVEGLEKSGYINILNGKKYLVRASAWTATQGEIDRCKILNQHIENIKIYIDPSIVTREWPPGWLDIVREKMMERYDKIGKCECSNQWIKADGNIPTNPPCQPRIIIKDEIKEEPK